MYVLYVLYVLVHVYVHMYVLCPDTMGQNNKQATQAPVGMVPPPAYLDKRDIVITCIYAASLNFFLFFFFARPTNRGFRLGRIYVEYNLLGRVVRTIYA